MVSESWKQIDGYSYEVSNFGRVRSLPRKVRNNKGFVTTKSKVLKRQVGNHGYPKVCLWSGGKSKTVLVHLLVLHAFGEKKPSPAHVCNHKDGDKLNSHISNLEWRTQHGNNQHAYDTGLRRVGEKHPKAVYRDSKVDEVRRLYATGKYTQRRVAQLSGISHSHVCNIINGKCRR